MSINLLTLTKTLLSLNKIEYIKQICVTRESTLKQINNRTFQIKNAIEWKKVYHG